MGDEEIWLVIGLTAVVTYLPRALGVALAGRIDPNGPVFQFVACIAYALLAGLIARMILFPVGPLQETALGNRLAAAALAFAVFLMMRRSVMLGVLAGTAALIGLTVGGVQLF